jgi:N-acetyl-anhydromuramyl-L-alanine amidase AmpD
MTHKLLRKLTISFSFILISLSFNLAHGATFKDTTINIIQLPVNYGKERIQLSLEYLKNRHGLVQSSPTITPKIIVLHYTEGGTIKSVHDYFNPATIENARQLNKKVSTLNVSSQYLVDRDGKIYQLMPDTLLARHAIGINYCAIGVENIGGEHNPLTEAQVIANAKLVRYLSKKYKIEYLVGHSEYIVFRNTPIWKETDPKYITYKGDPGKKFMEEVRLLTKDLNLKSKP